MVGISLVFTFATLAASAAAGVSKPSRCSCDDALYGILSKSSNRASSQKYCNYLCGGNTLTKTVTVIATANPRKQGFQNHWRRNYNDNNNNYNYVSKPAFIPSRYKSQDVYNACYCFAKAMPAKTVTVTQTRTVGGSNYGPTSRSSTPDYQGITTLGSLPTTMLNFSPTTTMSNAAVLTTTISTTSSQNPTTSSAPPTTTTTMPASATSTTAPASTSHAGTPQRIVRCTVQQAPAGNKNKRQTASTGYVIYDFMGQFWLSTTAAATDTSVFSFYTSTNQPGFLFAKSQTQAGTCYSGALNTDVSAGYGPWRCGPQDLLNQKVQQTFSIDDSTGQITWTNDKFGRGTAGLCAHSTVDGQGRRQLDWIYSDAGAAADSDCLPLTTDFVYVYADGFVTSTPP